jgi:glycosyltransferase involved in cell wall biosynthesis
MIPTFNCGRFLAETLTGVLRQDPGPAVMQIEVVDDHSTLDEPQAVVDELGRGRVAFHRQPMNVGHIANFETCLARARGELIHLLHGDDSVRDGFYRTMERAFDDTRVGAAFCRQVFIDADGRCQSVSPLEEDESGILPEAPVRMALEQRVMTPSIVVRRDVYEALGGFDRRLRCAEDWEMWVRIATRYAIWYETEPLALYRMHSASNTGRHARTGDDVRYTCMAIAMFTSYLPDHVARDVARRARQTYALSALETARRFLAAGDVEAARAQARAAVRCRPSFAVWAGVARLVGARAVRVLSGLPTASRRAFSKRHDR